MTTWQPSLDGRSGPRYVAIAEALAEDIDEGRLNAGQRLPTHRDLAWRLGVTVGTVTRAYAEAERRGLIAGEVGRGTFVRESVPLDLPSQHRRGRDNDFIDLTHNVPPSAPGEEAVAEIVADLSVQGQLGHFMGYEMGLGMARHRAAGAAWVAASGLPAEPDEIAISAGAQHAMLLAVTAFARPGDTVLIEELTFYGMKTLASLFDLRLHSVAMDRHGLLPEALDAACRSTGAKALYCMPTLQNPTTAIMPEARRREIAEICTRHDVGIVEDDVYGFLPSEAPPPVARFAPDQAIYVTSLSKSVAPGLRVGFVKAKGALLERVGNALRASTLMAPPLMAEVAARLIQDGRAQAMAAWQRDEARARQRIARDALGGVDFDSHSEAFHIWLKLPEPWRREAFTAAARARGIGLAPAEVFAVGRQPVPHAVRICLQAATSRAQLARALGVVSEILSGPPRDHLPMV